jgi:hypothetical protein
VPTRAAARQPPVVKNLSPSPSRLPHSISPASTSRITPAALSLEFTYSARKPARASNVKDAERHFRVSLRLKPDYADAHRNLGITHQQRQNRRNHHITELEAANRLQPDPEIQKDLERLHYALRESKR